MNTWTLRAACKGHTDEMFPTALEAARGSLAALALCRRCPVVDTCRAYGNAIEDPTQCYGVLGGETEEERRVRHGWARKRGGRTHRAKVQLGLPIVLGSVWGYS